MFWFSVLAFFISHVAFFSGMCVFHCFPGCFLRSLSEVSTQTKSSLVRSACLEKKAAVRGLKNGPHAVLAACLKLFTR